MVMQDQYEDVQVLRKKLADCETALQDERNRLRRLEAEALYVQTAVSKFVPSTSYLHPTATACAAQAACT
jgi:formate-dependent phosphoribosylglycinamide formyltransferase (GAR transformylase)